MRFLEIFSLSLLCCVADRTGKAAMVVDWLDDAEQSALEFATSVDDILETFLGHDHLQEHYNTLSFNRRRRDGRKVLDKIAHNFGQKLSDRNQAVVRLKTTVEHSLSTRNELSECCKVEESSLRWNNRFKQPIGDIACNRISRHSKKFSGYLSKKFEEASAENLLRMPFLRWQYFVSESGITSQYPAVKVDHCGSYDGRFRPFYVEATVPQPKDIVIVIDKSGSMSNEHEGLTLMEIAKEAAKTVVSTLNPHDRVTVIGFSDRLTVMGLNDTTNEECFGIQLAHATGDNVKSLNHFISNIESKGKTRYGLALSKAFDYFDKTVSDHFREKVILFLSDGHPTDSNTLQGSGEQIFNIIKTRNSQLNNSVVLLTYGLGNDDFSILQHMAHQNGKPYGVENPEAMSIKQGVFTGVTDPSDLRLAMGSYYSFFSKRTGHQMSSEPAWSLPYLDKWGMGLLMSVSLPVYDNVSKLAGVVGTDLMLDDFLTGAVYFRPSEFSYIFMIDSYGFVIFHPLFKYAEDHDVKYIDISAFEPEAGMISVIESMKRGGSGSKTFLSERLRPAGSSRHYGTQSYPVTTEVYWKQIPYSSFSICVVLNKNDEKATLNEINPRYAEKFLYHRLDVEQPKNPCIHYNNYCTIEQSTVSLSPRAFIDTDEFLNKNETADVVGAIGEYMESGRGGREIKEGIRNSVWATQEAERFWKSRPEKEFFRRVLRRYVGTRDGITRMYPGCQLPKDFDPVIRPWYHNAIANKGRTAFTVPYRDATSKENVISISKVIYGKKKTDVRYSFHDEVVAVIGMDIPEELFRSLLNQTYPLCSMKAENNFAGAHGHRCVLVDSAGFVLYSNTHRTTASPNHHITQVEPRVSESLISHGIMQHSKCLIMEKAKVLRTYKIASTESYKDITDGGCLSYQFAPIPETNIFMIVRRNTNRCPRTTCPCSNVAFGVHKCVSFANSCECPCIAPFKDYNVCINKYNYTGNVEFPKPCVPTPRPLKEVEKIEHSLGHLPKCAKQDKSPQKEDKKPDCKSYLGVIILLSILLLLFIIALAITCYLLGRKERPPMKQDTS